MRLQQPYCVWERHLPADFCDRISAFAEERGLTRGAVTYDPDDRFRDSEVTWIGERTEHAWIFEPLAEVVTETNRRHWHWRISGPESLQYTRYGEGQFYGWHADQLARPYPEEHRWAGNIRKISLILSLSGPDDYEGGELVVENPTPPPNQTERRLTVIEAAREKGTVVVFPSHLFHEVRPVTGGVRRSLVGWFLGPPFV